MIQLPCHKDNYRWLTNPNNTIYTIQQRIIFIVGNLFITLNVFQLFKKLREKLYGFQTYDNLLNPKSSKTKGIAMAPFLPFQHENSKLNDFSY